MELFMRTSQIRYTATGTGSAMPTQDTFYVVYNDKTLKELEPWLRTKQYNDVNETVRDRKGRLCIGLVMDYSPERLYSNRIRQAGYIMCSHRKLHARAIKMARKLRIGAGNRQIKTVSNPEVVIKGRKKSS